MGHEVVAMNFFEGSVFVAEVAPFSIWAKFLTVKLPAILRLILLVESCLGFSNSVDLSELFSTVCVLALEPVSAEADFCPVLAHFTLILFRLGQRNNLTILQEHHLCFLAARIESCGARWVELSRLFHERRLSRWNEGLALRSSECEWVCIHAHVVWSLSNGLA